MIYLITLTFNWGKEGWFFFVGMRLADNLKVSAPFTLALPALKPQNIIILELNLGLTSSVS